MHFIFNIQERLLLRWSICFSAILILTICWSKFSNHKASSPQRKLFHVPIVYVFVTGVKEDIYFLAFTSACLLIVFLVIEVSAFILLSRDLFRTLLFYFFLLTLYSLPFSHSQGIRLTKSNRLASLIDLVFDCFRDEKDFGPLTLSHIHLLIGCSLPVWITCSTSNSISLLAACSGAISIGIGDSAASIVGSYWGKRKWPKSKKSYEGTAAAFFCQVIGSIVIIAYFDPSKILTINEFLVICLTSLSVSLIEAVTNEVDNLVLPLYFYIILLTFSKLTGIIFP